MGDVKHTAGPWKLLEVGDKPKLCPADKNNHSILTVIEEDGVAFAVVYEEADARLIAAAPDLLEALIALRAACIGMVPECADQVDAAIAKATQP